MLDTGLADRTCLVTGAAGGIGEAVAALLAQQGADVVPCDRDAAAVDRLTRYGRPVAADLSTRAGVEPQSRWHGSAMAAWMSSCTARRSIARHRLPDVDDDEWDAVLDANLRSTFLLCQGAVEAMREHGDGRIVLFGSFAARTGGLRAGVPYAASKAGVEGVMRNVAAYAGPLGIRVNCIHPGYVDTQMVDRDGRGRARGGGGRRTAAAGVPPGRAGDDGGRPRIRSRELRPRRHT